MERVNRRTVLGVEGDVRARRERGALGDPEDGLGGVTEARGAELVERHHHRVAKWRQRGLEERAACLVAADVDTDVIEHSPRLAAQASSPIVANP